MTRASPGHLPKMAIFWGGSEAKSLGVESKPGLNVLSGSACLRYLVYIQGMLGTAIVIPSYALFAVSSP